MLPFREARESMEMYISAEVLKAAELCARRLLENGQDGEWLETTEGGPRFRVQRMEDGLLTLRTIRVDGEVFYLGTTS